MRVRIPCALDLVIPGEWGGGTWRDGESVLSQYWWKNPPGLLVGNGGRGHGGPSPWDHLGWLSSSAPGMPHGEATPGCPWEQVGYSIKTYS